LKYIVALQEGEGRKEEWKINMFLQEG